MLLLNRTLLRMARGLWGWIDRPHGGHNRLGLCRTGVVLIPAGLESAILIASVLEPAVLVAAGLTPTGCVSGLRTLVTAVQRNTAGGTVLGIREIHSAAPGAGDILLGSGFLTGVLPGGAIGVLIDRSYAAAGWPCGCAAGRPGQ